MNYYPHHIGDFNNATRHLERIERSIYRDMLDMYYDTEKPLPLDKKLLCRKILARGDEEVEVVGLLLAEFFTETEQGWHHQRCECEIKEYYANISAKSVAGKASAAKREADRLDRLAKLNTISTPFDSVANESSTPLDSVANESSTKSNQPEPEPEPIKTTTPNPAVAGPAAKPRSHGIALQTFIDECQANGERPLRDYAPLWAYAQSAGIETDHVALAWAEFCRRFLPSGSQPEKRQKDWRATFRKYVENNYFKLWAIDKDGQYFLTTQGKQAAKFQENRETA